jgi:hypothetical protein
VDQGGRGSCAKPVDAQMLSDGSRAPGNGVLRVACVRAVRALLDTHILHNPLLPARLHSMVQPPSPQPGT